MIPVRTFSPLIFLQYEPPSSDFLDWKLPEYQALQAHTSGRMSATAKNQLRKFRQHVIRKSRLTARHNKFADDLTCGVAIFPIDAATIGSGPSHKRDKEMATYHNTLIKQAKSSFPGSNRN